MHICKQAESGLGVSCMTQTGENSEAALMIQKVEKRGGGRGNNITSISSKC